MTNRSFAPTTGSWLIYDHNLPKLSVTARLVLCTGVYLDKNSVRIPIPARYVAPFSVSLSPPPRNLHIIIQKIFKFPRETNKLQQKKPYNYNANLFCCYSHLIIIITISSSAIFNIFFCATSSHSNFTLGWIKFIQKGKMNIFILNLLTREM